MQDCKLINSIQGFPIVGGGGRRGGRHALFSKIPPYQKRCPGYGVHHPLKNETLPI